MDDREVRARAIPWFRVSSLLFAFWAILFLFFPRFTNDLAALGYTGSRHAEDWTRIVGVFSLALSFLLNEAHRSDDPGVRRVVARGVLVFSLPCATLMAYWQIIPDGRWSRLDLANVALLYVISYGMLSRGGFRGRPDDRSPATGPPRMPTRS